MHHRFWAPAVSALLGHLLLSLVAGPAVAVELEDYDYIVVGSGAGGGPLAARLALAGHKTLLIEAGDDQGPGINVSVPAFSARASEDESVAWNFFVRHYDDDSRQAKDFKTTYRTADGRLYTGLDPPAGASILGTLYPRAATLGGCTAHNALVAIYPHRSDFQHIADLTGDASWAPSRMRRYYDRIRRRPLFASGSRAFDGWLSISTASIKIALGDSQLIGHIMGGALATGKLISGLGRLISLLAADANADTASRDGGGGYYQTPLSMKQGARVGPRDLIVAVRDAKKSDGSQKYPLEVRMHCHVTKIRFQQTAGQRPRAIGVDFLDGAYLYRASARAGGANKGIPGSATARREVIIAAGSYNTPQILKLSGVGPARELADLGIALVADLPGVGANLQDHYETAVQVRVGHDFAALDGCTFADDAAADACLGRWQKPLLGDKGTYASNGLPVSIFFRSSAAADADHDVFLFGGPINFRGYFPAYSVNMTARHDLFTWAILKAHPRNRAGSVTLRSADPLDVPRIGYNYFDAGSGNFSADLQAMREAIALARDALRRQTAGPVSEMLPGPDVVAAPDIEAYIRNTAWGHHASSSCPIGPDHDPMAVLDSSFRVRQVDALRVVDASVYPRIPGTFVALTTYIIAEKAADVILQQKPA